MYLQHLEHQLVSRRSGEVCGTDEMNVRWLMVNLAWSLVPGDHSFQLSDLYRSTKKQTRFPKLTWQWNENQCVWKKEIIGSVVVKVSFRSSWNVVKERDFTSIFLMLSGWQVWASRNLWWVCEVQAIGTSKLHHIFHILCKFTTGHCLLCPRARRLVWKRLVVAIREPCAAKTAMHCEAETNWGSPKDCQAIHKCVYLRGKHNT